MATRGNAHAWIARSGVWGFLGAATSALAGFALTVVVSRGLGPHGAGVVMQTIAVFSMLLALAKVGMDSTAIFLLPRVTHDSPHLVGHYVRFMGACAALTSTLVAAILWGIAPVVWHGTDPQLMSAIRTTAWFLPAGALVLVSAGAMRALGGMRPYVFTHNLALPLLRLGAIAIAVAATGSALTTALSWALPLIAIALVSITIVRRQSTHIAHAAPSAQGAQALHDAHFAQGAQSAHRASPAQGARLAASIPHAVFGKEDRHSILAYATPRTLSAGLEQALVWVDVVLVGYLAGAAAAGIYGGVGRFIQAGMIVDTALRVVVSPRLSALAHTGRKDELVGIHATTTQWLVLFATPVYLLMSIFAPTVMSLLGPEFTAGAPALTILSLAVALTFCAGNIHTLLLMSGRSGWAAFNKVIVLFINIVGNIVCVPVWGMTGAAAVWALSMLVDAALATIEVRAFLHVSLPLRIFAWPFAIIVTTTLIPASLVVLLWGQGLWPTTTATLLSVLFFSAACLRLRTQLGLEHLRR